MNTAFTAAACAFVLTLVSLPLAVSGRSMEFDGKGKCAAGC